MVTGTAQNTLKLKQSLQKLKVVFDKRYGTNESETVVAFAMVMCCCRKKIQKII